MPKGIGTKSKILDPRFFESGSEQLGTRRGINGACPFCYFVYLRIKKLFAFSREEARLIAPTAATYDVRLIAA